MTLAATVGQAACVGHHCAGVGAQRTIPTDTTVRVGASFAIVFQEGGSCMAGGPITYETVRTTWHTADTSIVSVDSATGTVTARSIGDAVVSSDIAGDVSVHVR